MRHILIILFSLLCLSSSAQAPYTTHTLLNEDMFNVEVLPKYYMSGTGNPEGVVTALPGTWFQRTDSVGRWYKASGTGNTGWYVIPLFSKILSTNNTYFSVTDFVDGSPVLRRTELFRQDADRWGLGSSNIPNTGLRTFLFAGNGTGGIWYFSKTGNTLESHFAVDGNAFGVATDRNIPIEFYVNNTFAGRFAATTRNLELNTQLRIPNMTAYSTGTKAYAVQNSSTSGELQYLAIIPQADIANLSDSLLKNTYKLDSVTVSNDSLYEWKRGVKTFRYLHTSGGGGGGGSTLTFGYGLTGTSYNGGGAVTTTVDTSSGKVATQPFVNNALSAYQAALGYTAENIANKATDFVVINNTKYPTTTAVDNYVTAAIAALSSVYAAISHTHTFASLTSKPTTLSGYGITDAQPLDQDLTDIAALTPTNDDVLQRKAGAWVNRSLAQLKSDISLSGTNTGDQTITLTGDVTGTGTGSFATVIGAGKVLNSMLAGSIAISKLSITGTPDGSKFLRDDGSWAAVSGSGTVTTASVVSANGFAGSVATATTTPAITISTTITGILKGNGTAISAATAGTDYTTPSSTETQTNKRITKRTGTTTSSATPTINPNNVDLYTITALAVDITSMTTNLTTSGLNAGDELKIAITGTATRAITWGASFTASSIAIPTSTSSTSTLYTEWIWNGSTFVLKSYY